jgi:hypothetical protein
MTDSATVIGDPEAFDSDAQPSINRRVLLGGAGSVVASIAAVANARQSNAQDATPEAGVSSVNESDLVWVFPKPGSVTASPGTQLTFRGKGLRTVLPIEVTGSESGVHPGVEVTHSDGNGVSWYPDFAFHAGERVEVVTRVPLATADSGDFSFTVSKPRPLSADPRSNKKPEDGQVHVFQSRPGLAPQVIDVTQHSGDLAPGLLFVAPKEGAGRNGALIMDGDGQPVWFFPVETPIDQILDFRVQTFQGKPVLTWWQGVVVRGHGFGHWVLRDTSYSPVTSIRIGNGYAGGDLHDLVLTEQETALVGTYSTIEWDIQEVGGKKDGSIIDCIVQEIDIATGAVIFEWHSLDHVAIDETHDGIDPKAEDDPLDHFHFNSINIDIDGNLVINARNTWAAYKVDRTTGDVIWRLGGEKSDFKLGKNAEMAYQHDVRPWPNGEVTLFDNGGQPQVHDESRGLVLTLDFDKMTAEVAREYLHPDHIFAGSQGNMQVLANGNVLVGWGSEPVLSEFTKDGDLVCDWRMFEDKQTYRAYKFEWSGSPVDDPIAAVANPDDGKPAVYVSWNGATGVTHWQLLAGSSASSLATSGKPVSRSGFETEIALPGNVAFVQVRALDKDGQVLGETSPVAVSG